MEGIRINGNMHHEKRVVILIGILSGICISLGFIRPFDGVITLSELVLQLSGSRGELSMSGVNWIYASYDAKLYYDIGFWE